MRSRQPKRIHLNGMDCLMTAFDYQMRKNGLAGNLAQMVIGLPSQIPESEFSHRVDALIEKFPILRGLSKRGILNRLPFWDIRPSASSRFPQITSHRLAVKDEADEQLRALQKRLFNLPLNPAQGEQIRFDLVYFASGEMEIYMTWVHALMDAHGAEFVFAMIGNPDLEKEAERHDPGHEQHDGPPEKQPDKWKKVKQSFDYIDQLAAHPPVSLFNRFARQRRPAQEYHAVAFSGEETRQIQNLSRKRCGLFNESTCYAAATLCELACLYGAKQVAADSFVLSLPVNLRKKGTCFPIFSNQSTSLLYSFSRTDLADFRAAAQRFKQQTQQAIGTGLLEANLAVMEISKRLPAWFYMKKVTQAMQGEIASIVFANPGTVHSGLLRFMGAPVEYVKHMPAIVTPPGIGVLFYRFSHRLYITFVYTEGLLTEQETKRFQEGICRRLLNGSEET